MATAKKPAKTTGTGAVAQKTGNSGAPKSAKPKKAAPAPVPAKMGRPTVYTEQKATIICEAIAAGESGRAACKKAGIAESMLYAWLKDRREFQEQYARARERQADLLAAQIIEIADTPVIGIKKKTNEKGEVETTEGDMIEHRRLQVDARKWAAGKLAPKKYGDKLAVGGDEDAPPIHVKADVTLTPGEAYRQILG